MPQREPLQHPGVAAPQQTDGPSRQRADSEHWAPRAIRLASNPHLAMVELAIATIKIGWGKKKYRTKLYTILTRVSDSLVPRLETTPPRSGRLLRDLPAGRSAQRRQDPEQAGGIPLPVPSSLTPPRAAAGVSLQAPGSLFPGSSHPTQQSILREKC